MHVLKIDDKTYTLEFRHKSVFGKRPELSPKGSISAITTCVLSGDGFIAIENAVCSTEDNFSRRTGRWIAFRKLLDRWPRLKDIRAELVGAYLGLWAPAPYHPVLPRRSKPSAEQVERWKQEGEPKRQARAILKSEGTQNA